MTFRNMDIEDYIVTTRKRVNVIVIFFISISTTLLGPNILLGTSFSNDVSFLLCHSTSSNEVNVASLTQNLMMLVKH
jgi:hypothetical protein